MDRPRHPFLQQIVDALMAPDPRLSFEGRRDDPDFKVPASVSRLGMAGVQMTVVVQLQVIRGERRNSIAPLVQRTRPGVPEDEQPGRAGVGNLLPTSSNTFAISLAHSRRRSRCDGRENLEGDGPLEVGVLGEEHFPHLPFADFLDKAVVR